MAGVIVHEWINHNGGAEKVLDSMVGTFPDAEVLTLWNDDAEFRYPDRVVNETWLAKTPLRRSKAASLPLMLPTWRNRKSPKYDWALVSSHLFAHHVSFANQDSSFRKYVYTLTPARYIWTPELDRRGMGVIPRTVSPTLRKIDKKRAQESYSVIAISEYVRERIQRTWERDSEVIFPPVAVDMIQSVADWRTELNADELALLDSLPESFVLGASRFVGYKRIDLVIEAARLAGLPVVIAGGGPLFDELKEQGTALGSSFNMIKDPSTALLYALYQRALVYVFPPIEDFGIMPVEAMALGTPVIVAAIGGASETVRDGIEGIHVEPEAQLVAEAIQRIESIDRQACVMRAKEFSTPRFEAAISDLVGQA